MKLSAKILKNVIDINHFQHSNQAVVSEGQANDIYIQLVDSDWSTKSSPETSSAFAQYPIRYISPATTLIVKANFLSIDDAKKFSVIATQPFANDKSIFKFALSSVQIPAAGNLVIIVNEDGTSKTFVINQALSVSLINQGSC